MSKDFKTSVIDAAITPNTLGKLVTALIVGAFVFGSMTLTIQRDIRENAGQIEAQQRLQTRNLELISTQRAEFMALSADLRALTVEVQRDRAQAEERRQVAQSDRDRMQNTLDAIYERVIN